jgi:hypothetical protein
MRAFCSQGVGFILCRLPIQTLCRAPIGSSKFRRLLPGPREGPDDAADLGSVPGFNPHPVRLPLGYAAVPGASSAVVMAV